MPERPVPPHDHTRFSRGGKLRSDAIIGLTTTPSSDSGGSSGSGGATPFSLTVSDEGTPLASDATQLDFVGGGVVASGTGATKTITITGASVGDILDLTTAETDAALVLAPDGAGGVEFRSETGGTGQPEEIDSSSSGATTITFTSPTSDDADLVFTSESDMACKATFTAENAETRRHLYVSHALGTGDFDVRMRIPSAMLEIQHTTTSTDLLGFFVADSSLTAATRQSIEYQPLHTGTTHADDQNRAIFFTNTTPNGQYMFGLDLPLIFRLTRSGTTISGYVSKDNGRIWGRVGSTVTASTDFQRIGLLGWGGGTGTTQKLSVLVHWLRKF